MWLNQCLLGSGYASVLVLMAVPQLRLSWSADSGGWKSCGQASGRMEKKTSTEKKIRTGVADTIDT